MPQKWLEKAQTSLTQRENQSDSSTLLSASGLSAITIMAIHATSLRPVTLNEIMTSWVKGNVCNNSFRIGRQGRGIKRLYTWTGVTLPKYSPCHHNQFLHTFQSEIIQYSEPAHHAALCTKSIHSDQNSLFSTSAVTWLFFLNALCTSSTVTFPSRGCRKQLLNRLHILNRQFLIPKNNLKFLRNDQKSCICN